MTPQLPELLDSSTLTVDQTVFLIDAAAEVIKALREFRANTPEDLWYNWEEEEHPIVGVLDSLADLEYTLEKHEDKED